MLSRLRGRFRGRSGHEVVVDGLLYVAVPYVVVGAVVTAFHLEFVRSLEAELAAHIPVFFDLIALGLTILGWPLVLVGSLVGVL